MSVDDAKMARESHQFIIDDLTAICNSLGKLDENDGTYMKDRDCKPCLREIQRYLNTDSKHHTARCTLGSYNIIKSDLIPLLVQYCDYNDGDPELFNTIIRLCTNITSSILLLFDDKQEVEDKEERIKLENKLINGLYAYKEAFAENDQIWSSLNVHLRHNRDDDLIFERLIILIRNILHIPVDSSGDLGVHSHFDAHDMCLYRMQKSGMLDTILELTSDSNKGAEFCFHLTEIIYLMLRDQNPETLAKATPSMFRRKLNESDVDKRRLAELSARNRRERDQRPQHFNQFILKGSTFVVKNVRSTSENPLVLNKPLITSRDELEFDNSKTKLRKAKNKKPLSSETSMYISDRNNKASRNSYSLRVFCEKFVKNVYNDYMQQIKHNLIQKRAQEHDESYYLWAIQFFTAFSYHLKLSIDFISETISTSTLHFIQVLMISLQEKIKIEKKSYLDISKRLHLALRAYKEILHLIKKIGTNPDFYDKIENIKKNIFTELEYSTLLLNLFQQYDEPKHSYHYLKDLINTNHLFLELLEDYSKTHGPIAQEEEEDDDDDELDDESDEEDDLKDFIDDKKKIDENVIDNNGELDEDDNIVSNKEDEIIGLFSTEGTDEMNKNDAGDEVKINDDQTNGEDKSIKGLDEIEEAHEKAFDGEEKREDIFGDDDVEEGEVTDKNGTKTRKPNKKKKKKRKREKSKKKKKSKTDFTSAHFMTRYCCPEVVKSHLKVLKDFKTNDESTNLALLKFFERIVYDCRNDVLLCQVSIFRCLMEIAEYHSSMPGQDGFKTLLIHLVETFGRMANKKRWMFQELLFWKTGNDVLEIENAIDPPPVPTITKVAEDNVYAANIFSDDDANIELNAEVNNEAGATTDTPAAATAATAADDDNQLPSATLDELRAELWGSDSEESSINIPAHSPEQTNENNASNHNSESNHEIVSNHDTNASNHDDDDDDHNQHSESNHNDNYINPESKQDDSDDSNFESEFIQRNKDNKHISDDDEDD